MDGVANFSDRILRVRIRLRLLMSMMRRIDGVEVGEGGQDVIWGSKSG